MVVRRISIDVDKVTGPDRSRVRVLAHFMARSVVPSLVVRARYLRSMWHRVFAAMFLLQRLPVDVQEEEDLGEMQLECDRLGIASTELVAWRSCVGTWGRRKCAYLQRDDWGTVKKHRDACRKVKPMPDSTYATPSGRRWRSRCYSGSTIGSEL